MCNVGHIQQHVCSKRWELRMLYEILFDVMPIPLLSHARLNPQQPPPHTHTPALRFSNILPRNHEKACFAACLSRSGAVIWSATSVWCLRRHRMRGGGIEPKVRKREASPGHHIPRVKPALETCKRIFSHVSVS